MTALDGGALAGDGPGAIRRGVYAEDGVRLSGLEAGPAGAPLVILLHGFPEDAQSWEVQIAALAAAGRRVVALDQRGYGDSDRPEGRAAYRLGRLVADVAAVAASLREERFDLVGHDWGGVVAWAVAARHPVRVRRLVILNAPHLAAMRSYLRRSPLQFLRSAYIALFQLPFLPELLLGLGDHALLARVLKRSSRRHAFGHAELARLRRGWRASGAMTAMLNWYRALPADRLDGGAVRVSAPTLILWGAKDRFLGRGLATAGAALCDDARIAWLEHATHWLHRDEPEAVSEAIVRFLAEA